MGLETRETRKEIMDVKQPPAIEVAASLRFLRAINRWLGGTRAILAHLEPIAPRRVLDIGTGAADIPLAVVKKFGAQVVAVDISPEVLAFAKAEARDPRIMFVRANAKCLPFKPNAFDAAISSLFFHHLSDDEAVALLGAMDRVAGGIVVSDLIRSRRLLWWTFFFTALSLNPLVQNDGPLSVRRAFTPAEMKRVRDRAGCAYLRVHIHFGHRMVLAGSKPGNMTKPSFGSSPALSCSFVTNVSQERERQHGKI